MINQRQKEKQELAKQYVKNHNLQKIVGQMLNSVIHAKDDNPRVFMIRYLSKLIPEQVLKKQGIEIKGPKPRTYPMLIYPDFPDSCKSMLKRHLTQNQWQSLRKKKTKHGGNLQFCIRAGTQDFEDQIGVYACDSDAYSRYSAMFMPLIQDLHKQDTSSLYLTSSLDSTGVEDCHSQIRGYVNEIRLTAHRNFSQTPFQPLLSHQDRVKIQMRVSEALKKIQDADLRGNYFTLSRLPDVGDMGQFLKENNINVKKTKLLDAAGITENWPDGRGIFISKNKSVFVKVNFQDHIEVIVLGKDGDFSKTLQKLRVILDTISDEVDPYSQNSKLGYLNASPRNLGHAFEAKVMIGGEAAIRLNHYLEQNEQSYKGVKFNFEEPNQQVSISSIEKFGISEKDILNQRIMELLNSSFNTPGNLNSSLQQAGSMQEMKTAGGVVQESGRMSERSKSEAQENMVESGAPPSDKHSQNNKVEDELDDQARSVVSSKKSVAAKFVQEDAKSVHTKKQQQLDEEQKIGSVKANSRPPTGTGKRDDKSQVQSIHSKVQTFKQQAASPHHHPAQSEIGSHEHNKGLDDEDLGVSDNRSEKGHDGMLQKVQSPKKSKANNDEEEKKEEKKDEDSDNDGGQEEQQVVDDVMSKTQSVKGDLEEDEDGVAESEIVKQNVDDNDEKKEEQVEEANKEQKKEEQVSESNKDQKKEQVESQKGGQNESQKQNQKDKESVVENSQSIDKEKEE